MWNEPSKLTAALQHNNESSKSAISSTSTEHQTKKTSQVGTAQPKSVTSHAPQPTDPLESCGKADTSSAGLAISDTVS